MGDPTVETEIALLKQGFQTLASKIDEVDKNCDARSDHTDSKIDDLLKWLIGTMGTALVTIAVYVITHQ